MGRGFWEGVQEGGQEVGVVDLEGEFEEDVLVAEGGFLEAVVASVSGGIRRLNW